MLTAQVVAVQSNLRNYRFYGIPNNYAINIGVRFLARVRDFSLVNVQICSGVRPASNTVGTRGCFPGGKAAGA
jgi:hypothetical protein